MSEHIYNKIDVSVYPYEKIPLKAGDSGIYLLTRIYFLFVFVTLAKMKMMETWNLVHALVYCIYIYSTKMILGQAKG